MVHKDQWEISFRGVRNGETGGRVQTDQRPSRPHEVAERGNAAITQTTGELWWHGTRRASLNQRSGLDVREHDDVISLLETADLCGASVATVKRRVSRAQERLARRLA